MSHKWCALYFASDPIAMLGNPPFDHLGRLPYIDQITWACYNINYILWEGNSIQPAQNEIYVLLSLGLWGYHTPCLPQTPSVSCSAILYTVYS